MARDCRTLNAGTIRLSSWTALSLSSMLAPEPRPGIREATPRTAKGKGPGSSRDGKLAALRARRLARYRHNAYEATAMAA